MFDFTSLSFHQKMAYFLARVSGADLAEDEAASLLTAVHADLEQPENRSASDYEQYAHLIQAFRQKNPALYEQVVSGREHPSLLGQADQQDEPSESGEPG